MLEQSFEHGTVYLSYVKSDSLITKSVKIPEIQFGPSRPVHIIVTDDFVYGLVRQVQGTGGISVLQAFSLGQQLLGVG